MSDKVLRNAWGDPIAPEDPDDPWWVPPAERKLSDEGPESDALGPDADGMDTGDDLDGWKPGDPA
jgi:hypothetical protein